MLRIAGDEGSTQVHLRPSTLEQYRSRLKCTLNRGKRTVV
jgi:hypothetical protein